MEKVVKEMKVNNVDYKSNSNIAESLVLTRMESLSQSNPKVNETHNSYELCVWKKEF